MDRAIKSLSSELARRARASTRASSPVPLLSGDDLIAAGHRPGPYFAVALDAAYDAQLAGHISSLDEAMAIAERTFCGNRA